ncbi:hypothetical protein D3C87_1016970 [compost metagenome]
MALGQLQQQVLEFHAGKGIHRAERFVEQQHLRPRVETAGDGHPLRHAAGKRLGQGLGKSAETDFLDQLRDPGLVVMVVGAEADVLFHRQPRHQPWFLKHKSHFTGAAAQGALEVFFQPGDDPQQGAFAATAGTEQADGLSGLQL